MIGVDWTLENFTVLDYIYELIGSDENGNNTEHGIISGIVRMSNVKKSDLISYQTKFRDIEFIIEPYADEDYIRTDFGEVITTSTGIPILLT